MINNPKAFMAGVWNWNILKGCFGETKIRPTDIDGCVERNGQTLIIETKAPNVSVPMGQFMTYETWARSGLFTVIVVWGKTDNPTAMMVFNRDGIITPKAAVTLEQFRGFVAAWYAWANQQKRGFITSYPKPNHWDIPYQE